MTLPASGLMFISMNNLIAFDRALFSKINSQWTGTFTDTVFPWLRESEFWLPVYLFLLVFIVMNFGKSGLVWAGSLVMTAIMSDLLSSSVIKAHIFRFRPCRDPEFMENVRLLVNYCPQSSSFTSSHACNHFAVATFIFFTLRHTSKLWSVFFLWAFAISYAQVYVGVHYPLDVISGAVIGTGVGYLMQFFFHKQFHLLRVNR